MLVLLNGEYVVLERVQHEILESPVAVYNFQVEDDHTYYVGESGILVHNVCQKHHMLTNKNKVYTPKFKSITDKYGLNLNKKWNIFDMDNHLGRHTTNYHEFMLKELQKIDRYANGNYNKFMQGFNNLARYVQSNPGIMYK